MSTTSKQPNGVDEMLNPENRARAEQYYSESGVGPTAEERYEHFRKTPKRSGPYYYNINYSKGTESDVSRLSLLEWMLWQWSGEI